MNYKELVAEGEKRQLHKRYEKDGSQCPDKKALRDYYNEKDDIEDEKKEKRIAETIKAYVEKRMKELAK